jgi:tartrate-resistant acid phosphatase type 5
VAELGAYVMTLRFGAMYLCIGGALLAMALSAKGDVPSNGEPSSRALTDAVVSRLPAEYREEAQKLLVSPDDQQIMAKLSGEELAIHVVWQLASKAEGDDFLLAQLEKESSPKLRSNIVIALRFYNEYWAVHPAAQAILQQHAMTDPDAEVSLIALHELRRVRMQDLGRLLNTRLDIAKKSEDKTGVTVLAKEQEIHYQWYGDVSVPSFMRIPPAVFSVKPADKSIRVLAFGDFGFGGEEQWKTAEAMVAYHKNRPFDFGITLGDNFYSDLDSPDSPQWQTQFEQPYGPMGIKIYPSFGNADYDARDRPSAEILYSGKSADWRFPAPYYTYTAGPVQFFALDAIDLSEAELLWLTTELGNSHAVWKVVYGHYPIYASGGEDLERPRDFVYKLLPVLKKGDADIYICGHHHNLQELKPDGRLHFFVSGGGGAPLSDLTPYDRTLFKDKVHGFAVLEADATHFKVSFISSDGKALHSDTLTK